MKMKLCGTLQEELSTYLSGNGFNPELASRILLAIYRKGICNPENIAGIPGDLKKKLSADFATGKYPPVDSRVSTDGTVKYLFRNDAGLSFETVYLPEEKRKTVCVSIQSGCRMGCPFCVSGQYGFRGNLTAGDIVNQVISIPGFDSVTHVVFMGMGEPMDNLEEVIKACTVFSLKTIPWCP